ncbi:hypothetical protein [Rhodoferax sp. BLA1]|uniref:hypothetical protein n=1 Tax=Rhodoferax sp. BLA1 TaxID=2576062 RepID=UPI0015D19718|nr:hypothetical protein [Rhodoferax sp. BLA1]
MSIQENFQTVLGVTTLLLGFSANGALPSSNRSSAAPRSGVVQSIALAKQQAGQTSQVYTVTLRMSDGAYQTLTQSTHVDIRVGELGQVDNGVLRPYV